jgi:hypothetical protein
MAKVEGQRSAVSPMRWNQHGTKLAIKIAAIQTKSAVADSEVVEDEPRAVGFVPLAAVSNASTLDLING